MTEVRCARRVAAPPAEVWRRLAEFDRLASWAHGVDHTSALTEARQGIGAARRVQVGTTVLVERVVAWEPERRLAYELQGLPPVVAAAVNEWTLEPDGDGSVVTLTARLTPGPRPPMRLAVRAVGRRIGSTNAGLLADLAGAVEQSRS